MIKLSDKVNALCSINKDLENALGTGTPYEFSMNLKELKKMFYPNDNWGDKRKFKSLLRYLSNNGVTLNIVTNNKTSHSRLDKNEVVNLVNQFRKFPNLIKEKKFNNISAFNFTPGAFYNQEWNELTTKARGLFIKWRGRKAPYILARGYEKFFEAEVFKVDTYNIKFPVTGYTKYNGFLGILGYDRELDELVFCSKSEVCRNEEQFYAYEFKRIFTSRVNSCLHDDIKNFMRSNKVSILFEVLSKNDKHIISRSELLEDNLVLLGAIKNEVEGSSIIIKDERIRNIHSTAEFKGVIESFSDMNSGEGYVFQDVAGHMWKVKTKYYKEWKYLRDKVIPYARKFPSSGILNGLPEDKKWVAFKILDSSFDNIVDARDFYNLYVNIKDKKFEDLSTKVMSNNRQSLDEVIKFAKNAESDSDILKLIEMSITSEGMNMLEISRESIQGKDYYIVAESSISPESNNIKSRIWDDFKSAVKYSVIRYNKDLLKSKRTV